MAALCRGRFDANPPERFASYGALSGSSYSQHTLFASLSKRALMCIEAAPLLSIIHQKRFSLYRLGETIFSALEMASRLWREGRVSLCGAVEQRGQEVRVHRP